MKKYPKLIFILILFSCSESKKQSSISDDEIIRKCEKKLTEIIIKDIFSPPVASRVYVYPFLAAYEAGRFSETKSNSITKQLRNFEETPHPKQGSKYDFTISAVKAFCKTAKKVVFSASEIDIFENQILTELQKRNSNEVNKNSLGFGEEVAEIIIKRLTNDNYRETRGMERFEVRNNEESRWQPTLPDYADATEPHWMKMKQLLMDSSAQFRHDLPIKYDSKTNSEFRKQANEVYETVKKITNEQDNIVRFWDDNPFVSRTKGHLMFQDKKMTPGGHWLAINRIISREKKLNFFQTLQSYTLTSISLFESFISCWDEKYFTALVRPETFIINKIDKNWKPYLITPPFPSYTSGHSTVSASAAEVLTKIYGENVNFTDSTEKEFGLPIRSFKSFRDAALEASVSRVYAGIHYRMDCENGNEQGIKVGKMIIERIKF